ncbi:MAG: polyribonucleotide nucleotidyltransferase [Patescibacteria group bacterium]|nr:polyribonucleotide nucleotidyltransferase [Patescibacteria group bacterium]
MSQKFNIDWAGHNMEIEIGRLAGQANGSCTVRYGDAVVLGTAVMAHQPREGIDFLPLTVEYEERLYAAGKIKGSRFIKREGRPSDEAVLTGRFIDRAIRPLFDKKIRNEIQVIVTVLSVDGENDPDVPAMVAASTALMISDIPWNGPVAFIRVGQIEGEWVLNPTYEAREKSLLDLAVAGTPERVIMLEAGANQVDEETAIKAIEFGQKHLKDVIGLISKVAEAVGKPKIKISQEPEDEEARLALEEQKKIISLAEEFLKEKIQTALFDIPKASKVERKESIKILEDELDEHLKAQQIGKDKRKIGLAHVYEFVEQEVSRAILEQEKRVDGRTLTEIRPLSAEVSILPRTHGSALFQRGATQSLSVVTLGAPGDEQTLEGMEINGKKHYMHHYNFPPYCVGETGRMGSPGRREIGHGALAEKALVPVLPTREEFPYTIRVVSETLSSNGSSSMAATCGSTLALMDAGVPLKEPVAGIAMGLAANENGDFKILTDLQDLEDSPGGMDFKIAGTRNGITAIQMDTKTKGLSPDIIRKTITQARDARLKILDVMLAAIPEPRKELSPFAPRIITIHINPDKIRDVIGPGGKIINEIIDKTGVQIDIEQDGSVFITSADEDGARRAIEWIEGLTAEPEIGKTYKGKVVRLLDFGAFVQFMPNTDGLIHVSELAPWRVERVTDVVNIGDEVTVKVIEIDDQGRVNLSLRQAEGYTAPPKPEGAIDHPTGGFSHRSDRPDRGSRDRNGRSGGRGFFKRR